MHRRRVAALLALTALPIHVYAQEEGVRIEITGSSIKDYRYPLGAASLLEKIETLLPILDPPQRVDSNREGRIETSWFKAPGRRVGLLWWQRELLTEARFIIVVTPLFTDPLGSSRYEIGHEVRERASDTYDWEMVEPKQSTSLPADKFVEQNYDRLYRALQQWKKR